MPKAVVPVDGCVEDFDREQRITINSDIGAKPKKLNLTKEDVETMADEMACKWFGTDAVSGSLIEKFKPVAIAGLKSVGIEVED